MARQRDLMISWRLNLVFVSILLAICIFGCKNEKSVSIPRQQAFPRMELQYDTTYQCVYSPFNIQVNENAKLNTENLETENSGFSLRYDKYSATLYCSFAKNLPKDSLNAMLQRRYARIALDLGEASADTYRFNNIENNCSAVIVYSEQNCATPVHFVATDSCRNVVSGVVVMDRIFNYDSIAPAINYLNKDVAHLINNLKFKN